MDVLRGNIYNGTVYTWMISGDTRFEVGFLIDQLYGHDDGRGELCFTDGAYLYHRLYAWAIPAISVFSVISRFSPSRC